MRRRSPANSIRGKLLLSLTALIAAIAVFIFFFFPAKMRAHAMKSAAEKAAAIRDVTAFALAAPVFFEDAEGVSTTIASAARTPEVTFVIVHNATGKVLGFTGDVPGDVLLPLMSVTRTAVHGSVYLTGTEIIQGARFLGTLTVGISLSGAFAEIDRAQRLGTTVSALLLLTGFLAVFLISRRVTQPLTAFARTVEQIAAGDLRQRAQTGDDAEIARLALAFNQMVDGLATAQTALSTANLELEARVEERTIELQSLVDAAPQAIIAVDQQWNITRWNRAAEDLFGWTAAEVLGKPVCFVPARQARVFESYQKRLEAGAAIAPEEFDWMRNDGVAVNVLVASTALRDRDGRPTGYLTIATDLTERRKLEEQLRQSQKMEAVGRLAGGVAHDFNNLLTVITSYTDLLRSEVDSDAVRDDLAQIAGAAASAAGLTRQLLMFSRKEIVQLRDLSLNAIVSNMQPMLRRLIRENVAFTTSITSARDHVVADPTQVEQVIMNLVVNALDAMPGGGSLHVETRCADLARSAMRPDISAGTYVQLLVRDTGIGMDAATIAKIFDPFFTTKDPGRGTGLGLATTYAIVTQLGGYVTVDSDVGVGTTFTVSLPCSRSTPASANRILPAATAAPMEHATILLVEDDARVRAAIRRGLQSYGFSVLEAPDGETGLEIAMKRGGSIDLVLTDLMMPGMNGRELADAIAQTYPGLRVIFMSGYADDSVDTHGLTDERHLFLQKPFTSPQLRDAIRSLLDLPAAERS